MWFKKAKCKRARRQRNLVWGSLEEEWFVGLVRFGLEDFKHQIKKLHAVNLH